MMILLILPKPSLVHRLVVSPVEEKDGARGEYRGEARWRWRRGWARGRQGSILRMASVAILARSEK